MSVGEVNERRRTRRVMAVMEDSLLLRRGAAICFAVGKEL